MEPLRDCSNYALEYRARTITIKFAHLELLADKVKWGMLNMEQHAEPTNPRYKAILYGLISAVVVNIAATGFLFYKTYELNSHIEVFVSHPLPSGLDTRKERMALFERFKRLYNAKKYNELHLLIDEAVRVQMTAEETKDTVDQLHNFTGPIKDGAYGSYEASKTQRGGWNYALYYPINTEKGRATLTILVFQQWEEPYRITGFHINRQSVSP